MKVKYLITPLIAFNLLLFFVESVSAITGQWLYVDVYRVADNVCYPSESVSVQAFVDFNTDSTGSCNDIPELIPNGSWSVPSNGLPYGCGISNNTPRESSVKPYIVKRCGTVRGSWNFFRVRVKDLNPNNTRKSTEEQNCKKNKMASNPVVIATGEKVEDVLDFSFPGISKIQLIRNYRSNNIVTKNFATSKLGRGWSHNYDKNISFYSDSVTGDNYAVANRLGGKAFYLKKPPLSLKWNSASDTRIKFNNFTTHYELETNNDVVEHYDLSGKLIVMVYKNNYQIDLTYNDVNHLITVTDNVGNSLTFIYDTSNRLSSVTKNSGEKIVYTYLNGMLDTVTNADNTFMSYIYDDLNQPNLLTGIIDAQGNRYATWSYDSTGRTLSGEHAGGIEKVSFSYNTDGSRTIKNSLNVSTTYYFENNNGFYLPVSIIGPGCSTCSSGDTS